MNDNELHYASLQCLLQEMIELRKFKFKYYPFTLNRCKQNVKRLQELRETYLCSLENYLKINNAIDKKKIDHYLTSLGDPMI